MGYLNYKFTTSDEHFRIARIKGEELKNNNGTLPVYPETIFKESVEFFDEHKLDETISSGKNISTRYSGVQSKLSLNLLSGEIKNLLPGSYVLATGCGSGKSTAVLDLMIKYFNHGIFYSAFTIDECDEIFEKLKYYGLDKMTIILHSEIFKRDDPQYKLSADIWTNRPEDIANFPIVIATQHKINNIPPSILLCYNTIDDEEGSHDTSITDKILGIASRKMLVRKFILIDEQTEKLGMSIEIDKSSLLCLIPELPKYGFKDTIIDIIYNSLTFQDLAGRYNLFEKNCPNRVPYNKKTPLRRAMNLAIIEEVANNLTKYCCTLRDLPEDKNISIDIKYSSIQKSIMKNVGSKSLVPYFIVFDGVGDFTYAKTDVANIIVSRNYNGKVNFVKVPELCISRKTKENERVETFAENFRKNTLNTIVELCNKGNKTLICLPKSFTRELYVNEDLEYMWNDIEPGDKSFSLFNLIKRKLNLNPNKKYNASIVNESTDYIDPNSNVVITYYQSPISRGSNLFKDFDQVILIGNIGYPPNVTSERNKFNGSKATRQDYEIQMLHQLIARTRIRNYEGKDVTVYYSDSYDSQLIWELNMTFNTTKSKTEIDKFTKTKRIYSEGYTNTDFGKKIFKLNNCLDDKINKHDLKFSDEILEIPMTKVSLLEILPELNTNNNFSRNFKNLNGALIYNHRCKIKLE